MEYPVWHLNWAGGGLLIALMSVVHVYVAHFAVGGGLFLVASERMARRSGSPELLEYTRRHTKFFLLLTMVFGGLTGVGIWLTISTISPGATSVLIHTFVFGWATEWVCFILEIAALLIYYYGFKRMRARDHMAVGLLYFLFAWLSLFLITGIVDFMLTPGAWLETRSFWDGFFNPSFWPSVAFRTAMSFTFGGVYGFLTAMWIKDPAARERMVRYCAAWASLPFILVMLTGWWYVRALPEAQRTMVLAVSPETGRYMDAFPFIGALIAAGGLAMALRLPKAVRLPLSLALLALGLLYMGAFEFVREAGRRPWLVHGHMYSTQIAKAMVPALNAKGILAGSKWTRHKEVTDENRLEAGKEIYMIECSPCHSIGGPLNDIRELTAHMPAEGVAAVAAGMGRISAYMPPFVGTDRERMAMAAYVAEVVNGRVPAPRAEVRPPEHAAPVPEFDAENAEYALFAYNARGMNLVMAPSRYWIIQPPGNTLTAMVVRRGPSPEMAVEGIEVRYQLPPDFQNPAKRSDFWAMSKALYGREIPADTGLSGNATTGAFAPDPDGGVFRVSGVPVLPYAGADGFDPYPLMKIEARDTATGKVVAATLADAPASTEVGCKNCHGGPLANGNVGGISDETAGDVLRVHDRTNKTSLLARAQKGKPVNCRDCHGEESGGINLSAAMHGLHAVFLPGRGAEACADCHPDGQGGPTVSFRGLHSQIGYTCVDCHGTLEDHAIGLLKHEKEKGVENAGDLLSLLKPGNAASVEEIKPRIPWKQEPRCGACHTADFILPDPAEATAFNSWSEPGKLYSDSRDELDAVPCAMCHNSPHAIYPADNPFGEERDNAQPMQYTGEARTIGAEGSCTVCHVDEMDYPAHHPNMGLDN